MRVSGRSRSHDGLLAETIVAQDGSFRAVLSFSDFPNEPLDWTLVATSAQGQGDLEGRYILTDVTSRSIEVSVAIP